MHQREREEQKIEHTILEGMSSQVCIDYHPVLDEEESTWMFLSQEDTLLEPQDRSLRRVK